MNKLQIFVMIVYNHMRITRYSKHTEPALKFVIDALVAMGDD